MDAQPNHIGSDAAPLRAAMEEADIVPLLLVLAHLSGDEAILDEAAPYIHGAWNFMHTLPAALQARIRDRLAAVLADHDASGRKLPATPPPHLLRKMLDVGVGQQVPQEYVPLLLEEMRLGEGDPRSVAWRARPPAAVLAGFRAVIIGAGLSGLCMAIKLREAGIPFTIIEKNPTVGGTWYENTYPGCGVDTPNHFFSYSFALPSPPTTTGRSTSPSATSSGVIWSAAPTTTTSAATSASTPRSPRQAGTRHGRAGTSRFATHPVRPRASRRMSWSPRSASSTAPPSRTFRDWTGSPGRCCTPGNGITAPPSPASAWR